MQYVGATLLKHRRNINTFVYFCTCSLGEYPELVTPTERDLPFVPDKREKRPVPQGISQSRLVVKGSLHPNH